MLLIDKKSLQQTIREWFVGSNECELGFRMYLYEMIDSIPAFKIDEDVIAEKQWRRVMQKDEWAKMSDQVENAIIRATDAKKDSDLVLCLKAIKIMMDDELRNAGKKGDSNDRGSAERK